jgi:hypothetical protein
MAQRPDPSAGGWCALPSPCAGHGAGDAADVRCTCGSLLARWTAAGLELKCRRCKRHIVVPVDGRRAAPK